MLPKLAVADNFIERSQGLLFTSELSINAGLLITHCNSIHMFFMRYAIDVIYLNKQACIVKVIENLKPWRMSFAPKADTVVELSQGALCQMDYKMGDTLSWQVAA